MRNILMRKRVGQMISKEKLINDILQSGQDKQNLSDANYIFRTGYMERKNEIIDIINAQPVINADEIDELYLQVVKENAELKKQLAAVNKFMENEPRFMLDKESICYGCPYFKKVEDCGGIPAIDDIVCGGACDCVNPCFEGSQNDYGLEVEDVSQDCSAGWKKAMISTFLGSRRGDI